MTYLYTDVPANRGAVIDAIVNFAVANAGFTNEGADGDLSRISKGGFYWCFIQTGLEYNTYGIYARLTTVIPTLSTYTSVSGQNGHTGIGLDNYTGPYTGLHLFTDGVEVNCLMEVVPGAFSHLSFGSLSKFGTWTGGQYLTGSIFYGWGISTVFSMPYNGGSSVSSATKNALYYNDQFYHDGTAVDNKKVVFGGIGSVYNAPLYNLGYALYNYRRPLLPIYAIIEETGVRSKVVGASNQARFLNLDQLQNKEIVETDWMVFPYSQRTAIISTGNSGNYGLAYKR